jgi:hypothetical protein
MNDCKMRLEYQSGNRFVMRWCAAKTSLVNVQKGRLVVNISTWDVTFIAEWFFDFPTCTIILFVESLAEQYVQSRKHKLLLGFPCAPK